MEITDPQTSLPRSFLTRRRVVGGVVVAGAAAPILAACGGGGDQTSTTKADDSAQRKPKNAPAKGGDNGGGGGGGDAAGGKALAKTSDIPVDGGKVFSTQKVVVTQPKQGEFKAFSAICTHMGCTVAKVQSGVIMCPCHGSKFSASDGSVKGGPATSPLAAKQIKVDGDSITLG